MNFQEFFETSRISAPVRKSAVDEPKPLPPEKILRLSWTCLTEYLLTLPSAEQPRSFIEADRAALESTGTGQGKVEETHAGYEVAPAHGIPVPGFRQVGWDGFGRSAVHRPMDFEMRGAG